MFGKLDITSALQEHGLIEEDVVVKKINFYPQASEVELECVEKIENIDHSTGEEYYKEYPFITHITWNEFEDLF